MMSNTCEQFLDTEINGYDLRIYKFNAFEQLDLVADLLSLIDMSALKSKADVSTAFINGISKMPSEKRHSLVKRTLKKTYLKPEGAASYSPLISGNELMFDNLELFDIISIMLEVITFNMGNFSQRVMQLKDKVSALKSIK